MTFMATKSSGCNTYAQSGIALINATYNFLVSVDDIPFVLDQCVNVQLLLYGAHY
jgi:hypothetical protein